MNMGTCKVACKYCPATFTGSAKRIRKHIVEKCLGVPEAIKQKLVELQDLACEKRALKQRKLDLNNTVKILDHFYGTDDAPKRSIKAKCDEALATWIFTTLQSFSVVESESFKELVSCIQEYGGGNYSPPSADTVRTRLLDEAHARTTELTDAILSKSENNVALTFVGDGMTNNTIPVQNNLALSPYGAIHLGIDDVSNVKKDCKSTAHRIVARY
jgi:hypothetical protein